VRLALLAVLLLLAPPAAAQAIREVPIPHALFPSGLTVAPDGTVLIADRLGDQLIGFAPDSQRFTRVELEKNTQPRAVAVDGGGGVWLANSGMGRVDRLNPPGRVKPGDEPIDQFTLPPQRGSRTMLAPWALALPPAHDVLWFTVDSGLIGRLPTATPRVRRGSPLAVQETKVGSSADRLYGIAAGPGVAWAAAAGSDQLIRITETGDITRVALGAGSRPRSVAVGADGVVWAALYGRRQLARVDPRSLEVTAWALPSGERAVPAALAVDGAGAVWIADMGGDAIVRFEPARQRFTSLSIPTRGARVQALAVDARGRLWYVGAVSRRLGVVE